MKPRMNWCVAAVVVANACWTPLAGAEAVYPKVRVGLDDAKPGLQVTFNDAGSSPPYEAPTDWGYRNSAPGDPIFSGGRATLSTNQMYRYQPTPKGQNTSGDVVGMSTNEDWAMSMTFEISTEEPGTKTILETSAASGGDMVKLVSTPVLNQYRLDGRSGTSLYGPIVTFSLTPAVEHTFTLHFKAANSRLDFYVDDALVASDFEGRANANANTGPPYYDINFIQVDSGQGGDTGVYIYDEIVIGPLAPISYLVNSNTPAANLAAANLYLELDWLAGNPRISWDSSGMRSFKLESSPSLLPPAWSNVVGTLTHTFNPQAVSVLDGTVDLTNVQQDVIFYRVQTELAPGYHATLFNNAQSLDGLFSNLTESFTVPGLNLDGFKSEDASVTLLHHTLDGNVEAIINSGSVSFLVDGVVIAGRAGDRFKWNVGGGPTQSVDLVEGSVSVGSFTGKTVQANFGAFAMIQSSGEQGITLERIDEKGATLHQHKGSGSLTSFDSVLQLSAGDSVGFRKTGTSASTFSARAAPAPIPVTMNGLLASFTEDDIVQVGTIGSGSNAYTWIHVVESTNGVPFIYETIDFVCDSGTAVKLQPTPQGAGSASFENIEGETRVTTADGVVFSLFEDSVAAVEVISGSNTRLIGSTHSWGTMAFADNGATTTGTVTRGQKIDSSSGSVVGPVAASQPELDAVGADPYTVRFDDFNSGLPAGWSTHQGTWVAQSNEYHQTDDALNLYRSTVNFPMMSGMVRSEARVVAINSGPVAPFGSFGPLYKYQDSSNYGQTRWGSYRAGEITHRIGNVGIFELKMGHFIAVPGETHVNEVYLKN